MSTPPKLTLGSPMSQPQRQRSHTQFSTASSTISESYLAHALNLSPVGPIEYPSNHMSNPSVLEKLRQELELEQMENQSLNRQLQEYRKNLDSALQKQEELEMDVVDLANQVQALERQTTDLKRSKHQLENEFSQEQMNYMNEKAQWLDKESESAHVVAKLKDQVSRLKHSLEEQQIYEASLLSSLSPSPNSLIPPPPFGHSRGTSINSTTSSFRSDHASSFRSEHASSFKSEHAKETSLERLKNELEMIQLQTEMMSKEYALRNEKMERELQDSKLQVTRLIEENEGFQAKLAERILGESETESQDRPLRLILERLVQRLLEFSEFEKLIDVDEESISNFQEMMTASGRHARADQAGRRVWVVRNPMTWVSLIFGDLDFSAPMGVSDGDVFSVSSVLKGRSGLVRPQLTSQTKLRELTIKC